MESVSKLAGNGPPVQSKMEIDHIRYFITDLVDDIRESRNKTMKYNIISS